MDPENFIIDENEFKDEARLQPENIPFPAREKLRKTSADMDENQIEYLSVAALEKDISPEQLLELEINLKGNPASRAVFESIQKTKLAAPSLIYKNKSSLKKLTAGRKVFRIAASVLSAAAVTAILIISYIFRPDPVKERNPRFVSETTEEAAPPTLIIEKNNPIIIAGSVPSEKKVILRPAAPQDNLAAAIPDSEPPALIEYQSMPLAFIPVTPAVLHQDSELLLMGSNNKVPVAGYEEERGRVRRFIASTFRERVLGEKIYSDDRIKPIELAIASVDGLNKLLDWKMELKETVDKSGKIESVYFSSALLTFNSPVRKTNE